MDQPDTVMRDRHHLPQSPEASRMVKKIIMARSRMVYARDWDEEEQEPLNYLIGETDKIWKWRMLMATLSKHTNTTELCT